MKRCSTCARTTSTGAPPTSAGSPATATSRAELSGYLALLERDRQAQGEHLLHRSDRHPCADARGRGAGEEDVARRAAPAWQRRRADQSGSLAMVLRGGRRQPLPDRRYLVADRNRRHPDLAAGRCDGPHAGLGHPALLRRAAGAGQCRWRDPGRPDRGQPDHP
ncbi:hypothetical protein G6F50_015936 [Rhizopus delemar]|uniref:Uncharacterized protein n=1 Tax=Rhizopus delemar TaxID=936053 RepID=A0A9P7C2R7_9FUNG|nr:hypothetical protein G6F50_015936 [Rhizopus delemar]